VFELGEARVKFPVPEALPESVMRLIVRPP